MKPPIIYDIYEIIQKHICGRVIGTNIHIGDKFTELRIRECMNFYSEEPPIYEYEVLYSDVNVEIEVIHCFNKDIEWLHAPYSSSILIDESWTRLVSEVLDSITQPEKTLGFYGPYSSKSDITGGGRW